jgi:RNA polymerase sigma-70 factor (ECF subfamily)
MEERNGETGARLGEAAQPSDSSLARRVQLGERQAFETLAGRYLGPIHAVVASFLREPADIEDVAQETFLRALDRIHTYDANRPFAPWLYQIARNVARSRKRAHGRWRSEQLSPDTSVDLSWDPTSDMEREQIRQFVLAAMHRLPAQRRTAFRLFDVEGYSAEEAAGLMGISVGTVRSHVYHARRALRTELEPLFKRRGHV